jgi:hypothetical protein
MRPFLLASLCWAILSLDAYGAPPWPMDEVRLKTGEVYRGMLASEDKKRVEFVSIHRPKGRPMFAVVLPVFRQQIESIKRVKKSQRQQLAQRIDQFRFRAQINSLRRDLLSLVSRENNGQKTWIFEGRRDGRTWFTIESHLDEETTRRMVVRIEQIFTAYRRTLPPTSGRRLRTRPLRIVLFGTQREYQAFLEEREFEIGNPAFFAVEQNLIAAGSDLGGYLESLARTRKQHRQLLAEYGRLQEDLPGELRRLSKRLAAASFSSEQRAKILGSKRRAAGEEIERLKNKIETYDRRNRRLLDEVTAAMFTRLYHEAFHAYIENFVYDARRHDLPRWLNEGLAQLFEQGQLDSDSLRLDRPDPQALKRLQNDLRGKRPLRLADLLRARQEAFLVMHGPDRASSSRHYLYSWGVVYYLTVHRSLLTRQALDQYVDRRADRQDLIKRFERLVGMPLEKFEREWRAEILEL